MLRHPDYGPTGFDCQDKCTNVTVILVSTVGLIRGRKTQFLFSTLHFLSSSTSATVKIIPMVSFVYARREIRKSRCGGKPGCRSGGGRSRLPHGSPVGRTHNYLMQFKYGVGLISWWSLEEGFVSTPVSVLPNLENLCHSKFRRVV